MICTGANTFFGRAASLVGQDDDSTGHLQKILAQIGSFCLVSIGIFVIAEIFVLYAGFRYEYRRGLNNILVLLIGGIPIAMPTVLSVTLALVLSNFLSTRSSSPVSPPSRTSIPNKRLTMRWLSVSRSRWTLGTGIFLASLLGLVTYAGLTALGAWKDIHNIPVWSLRLVELVIALALALDIVQVVLLVLLCLSVKTCGMHTA